LFLSSDSNPQQARKIVTLPTYTLSREWDRNPAQRSEKISLVANQSYYIEGMHEQSEGEDCFAVAWEGPGIAQAVIDGRYLSPCVGGQGRGVPERGVLREFWLNYQGSFGGDAAWLTNPPVLTGKPISLSIK